MVIEFQLQNIYFINTPVLQSSSIGTVNVDEEVINCITLVEENTFGAKMLQCLIFLF